MTSLHRIEIDVAVEDDGGRRAFDERQMFNHLGRLSVVSSSDAQIGGIISTEELNGRGVGARHVGRKRRLGAPRPRDGSQRQTADRPKEQYHTQIASPPPRKRSPESVPGDAQDSSVHDSTPLPTQFDVFVIVRLIDETRVIKAAASPLAIVLAPLSQRPAELLRLFCSNSSSILRWPSRVHGHLGSPPTRLEERVPMGYARR